jgi:hypothetical protein
MTDTDITILGFSEAGRAALALIENLREDSEELDTLKAAIAGQLPYTLDDGTDDDASPIECVEYAGAEISTIRAQLAAEKARADAAERFRDELGFQYEALKARYRLAMCVVDLARPLRGYLDLQCAVAAVDAVPGDEGKR